MFPRSFLAPAAGIAIFAAAAIADAQPRRVQVGTLSCSVSAGIGLIVASQRNVNCNFQPDNGPPEAYTGTMTIIGVDVGFTTGSAIVWGVFTDTNRFARPGAPSIITHARLSLSNFTIVHLTKKISTMSV